MKKEVTLMNKTVMITGASSGIGLETALIFLKKAGM
jgi:NAD(P)-dependent dehydrogenase (short-subunit alcohol dehydrogenase family)